MFASLARRFRKLTQLGNRGGIAEKRTDSSSLLPEALEGRCLLSGAVAKAIPWPAAPFDEGLTTIYVNQFGHAQLPGEALSAAAANRYRLYFDDPGQMRVRTTGNLPTQLALYPDDGRPTKVAAGRPTGGAILASGVESKQIFYFAVRGRNGALEGTFGLNIEGVDHAVVRNLHVRSNTHAGTFQTTISSPGDADFYEFTATRSGTWRVSVIPRPVLDATMHIFDADGNPVGGTFTRPINDGGAGVAEHWVGAKVRAGEQYFIRIDGLGDSMGYYQVRAQHLVTPALSVRPHGNTVAPGDGGFFIVTRSNRSSLADALRVNYTLVAANGGEGYAPITGVAIIRAGQRSGRIDIRPMLDTLGDGSNRVGIVLHTGEGYTLGGKRMASISISSAKR